MLDTTIRRFDLVVPAKTGPNVRGIARGSAIVARESVDGLRIVDFEGNLYKAAGLETFEGRLQIAAGRAHVRAATIARTGLPVESLVTVGVCVRVPALHGWIVESLTDAAALEDWLDGEPLPVVGGSQGLWDRAIGLMASRGGLRRFVGHPDPVAALRTELRHAVDRELLSA
jgi:hypothetical protein